MTAPGMMYRVPPELSPVSPSLKPRGPCLQQVAQRLRGPRLSSDILSLLIGWPYGSYKCELGSSSIFCIWVRDSIPCSTCLEKSPTSSSYFSHLVDSIKPEYCRL